MEEKPFKSTEVLKELVLREPITDQIANSYAEDVDMKEVMTSVFAYIKDIRAKLELAEQNLSVLKQSADIIDEQRKKIREQLAIEKLMDAVTDNESFEFSVDRDDFTLGDLSSFFALNSRVFYDHEAQTQSIYGRVTLSDDALNEFQEKQEGYSKILQQVDLMKLVEDLLADGKDAKNKIGKKLIRRFNSAPVYYLSAIDGGKVSGLTVEKESTSLGKQKTLMYRVENWQKYLPEGQQDESSMALFLQFELNQKWGQAEPELVIRVSAYEKDVYTEKLLTDFIKLKALLGLRLPFNLVLSRVENADSMDAKNLRFPTKLVAQPGLPFKHGFFEHRFDESTDYLYNQEFHPISGEKGRPLEYKRGEFGDYNRIFDNYLRAHGWENFTYESIILELGLVFMLCNFQYRGSQTGNFLQRLKSFPGRPENAKFNFSSRERLFSDYSGLFAAFNEDAFIFINSQSFVSPEKAFGCLSRLLLSIERKLSRDQENCTIQKMVATRFLNRLKVPLFTLEKEHEEALVDNAEFDRQNPEERRRQQDIYRQMYRRKCFRGGF